MRVRVSHDELRVALAGQLRRLLEPHVAVAPDEPELNDGVVVAASTSLTPEECAELAGQGKPVIVLAPLPTKSERNRYLSAGARGYLPMSLDLIPLVVLIESVLHRV